MTKNEVVLTAEGVKELEEKLEYLKSEKRYEISEQIKQARAFGDISENAEYDEAKNEQARIEGEILEIQNILKVATIIDDGNIKTDTVSVGSTVKIHDLDNDEEMEFTIVGSKEANPEQGRISNESPVGQALVGNKKDKTIVVSTPKGENKFKILNISK